MENQPKKIEEMFELHDLLIILEKQGKELNGSVDRMILRLRAFQTILKHMEASAPKGAIKENSMIDDLDKDVEKYEYWKAYWKDLVKQRIDVFNQLEVNKTLKLRSHPEQFDSTQAEEIVGTCIVFKLLIGNHSHALITMEKFLKNDEISMNMIDEALIESAKQSGDWPEIQKLMGKGLDSLNSPWVC